MTGLASWAMKGVDLVGPTMSDEQLSAFLQAIRADAGFQEKLKSASNLDAALAIAKSAGFDLSKEELLSLGANETSEAELEGVAGGYLNTNEQFSIGLCPTQLLCF